MSGMAQETNLNCFQDQQDVSTRTAIGIMICFVQLKKALLSSKRLVDLQTVYYVQYTLKNSPTLPSIVELAQTSSHQLNNFPQTYLIHIHVYVFIATEHYGCYHSSTGVKGQYTAHSISLHITSVPIPVYTCMYTLVVQMSNQMNSCHQLLIHSHVTPTL